MQYLFTHYHIYIYLNPEADSNTSTAAASQADAVPTRPQDRLTTVHIFRHISGTWMLLVPQFLKKTISLWTLYIYILVKITNFFIIYRSPQIQEWSDAMTFDIICFRKLRGIDPNPLTGPSPECHWTTMPNHIKISKMQILPSPC